MYSHRRLVLLDDVFAGLDNATATSVFNKLLGANGLLRKAGTTVLLATSTGLLSPTLLREPKCAWN